VAFWNNGKKVIRNVDLVPSDLLRIEAAKGEKILWVEVRKEYEKANNIKITIDHSSRFAKIDFKFLGLEDGCVVEVYHTGKGDLKVLGTVIGSNKIRNACYSEDYFLDKLLDPINELIGRIKSPLLERLFGLIVIVGCFPIALICIVLDMMFRISYRVPKKYSFG
jgi:hypothetical protein